ncbi:MAG: carbohydrate ABC transporter permease [Clostridiales bacterium]|nr:carbohydrate ABC transporter permease [Clostridiales bacterium]
MTAATHVVKEKKPKIWSPGQVALCFFIFLVVLTCVLPFLNVIAISLSSKSAILRGDVSFWPVEFSTKAYQAIFSDKALINSLWYTIKLTVIYTVLAMVMTILMAYPLTKKRLHGRNFFSFLALFTMYFSGGTIPIYLNVKEFGMLDTMWSLIIPGLLSTYNMIIMKSFFASLPSELEEAATIDGANDFQILLQVYLPLSLASIATLTLFYAVGKWNSFADAKYYITSRALQPLQLKLYNIIKGATAVDVAAIEGGSNSNAQSISESIESATIIFATLPILVVYPFVQRYFVSGVTIGAVKG